MNLEIIKDNMEKLNWTKPELILNNVSDTEGKDANYGTEFTLGTEEWGPS